MCDFAAIVLIRCSKLLRFFINIYCFGGICGASLGTSNVHVQRPQTTRFHLNRINPAELWRYVNFLRWHLQQGNFFASDFVFGDFAQLGRLPAYQISAIYSQSTVEILLLPAYQILSFGPLTALLWHHSDFEDGSHGIAFLLLVSFSWLCLIRKVPIYLLTKFQRDISICGWDITTPSFWKQTFAMLEFYFRFWFHLCIISMSFCICLPNFVQIGLSMVELWHHNDF